MAALAIVGCDTVTGNEGTSDSTESTSDSAEVSIPDSEAVDNGELHVLITSDVHYCATEWYGVGRNERLQLWVDAINEEHAANPFDVIIVAGDTSLDYYYAEGSYTSTKLSMTKKFMKDYVSQLPKDVPVFVMPGNHEAYTNEKWKEITGQDRQQSYAIKGNLFIMLDNFGSEVGDKYDQKKGAPCTPTDVNYIKEQIAANPDCSKVWLIAHYFDTAKESDEFKELLKTEKKIKGLFEGHQHKNIVVDLGADFGGHKIAHTGNFSYSCSTAYPVKNDDGTENLAKTVENLKNSMWGFRELNITNEAAISNYIICKSDIAVYKGEAIKVDRKITDRVKFY